ncbi:16S rRNA (cytosine(1402)-N(4))-methyltransferase [Candidatus Shapirobacteria bacterium CG10_big_fil_rev_8_21_14_0_10_48_15]|uniref:Ribosomal RNA small subunit methyltransferase H n=1 Tax=Candidatus Shapirobacteria bacterium CG10_big_fil_rev_8_21_14_0_10_48_15 TaxID=1974484 RepID=A0A2M8L6E6_9BACT|nr:MAG: 16S rRNA (cytosine(1402)-N(4))-methyltransferase [Candidatus Shapirobacteria bacterium CG10_big_fil_rev_8_21_14_0_10_48_15]
MKPFHTPVLLHETIKSLNVNPGERYVDATVGGGGHSLAILEKQGIILAIDCDPEALKAAKRRLSSACPSSWQLASGNFAHLQEMAQQRHFTPVAGVLFDLGVSSHQLEATGRGFSFNQDGPLDMRMDPSLSVTAADLVNGLTQKELIKLFTKYGQESWAAQISRLLVQLRSRLPIKTTRQLAAMVSRIKGWQGGIHPATQVFQALRMAVNDELNNLRLGLAGAVDILKPGGRLVVISFHSGEDRIVKNFFRRQAVNGQVAQLTKKPVRPTPSEVARNPRSRSAKLRSIEKK